MTGALLNAIGILVGGILGLMRTAPLTPQSQAFFRVALGVFTVYYGLRLTWMSIDGPFYLILKQIVIAFLAILIGKHLGRLLRFQEGSNHAGQYAKKLIEETQQKETLRFSNGLVSCAILFCASPLGLLGAVTDGLPGEADGRGYFYPLVVKAAMDGLAMMSFVRLFGLGAMLSALPVFLLLGTISSSCLLYVQPFLAAHGLLDSVNAVAGLIICTIGTVIFEIKRIELAEYLPALAIAPLITWVWK